MNIKKFLIGAAAGALMLGSMAIPALAAPGGKDSPANDNPQNVYLYAKDASWNIVWGGAWGKYNYKLSGTTISGPFNGHGLVPGTDYTLISYNDPWGSAHMVIGSGVADANGNVHIKGTVNLGVDGDSTWDQSGAPGDGYKIWLVKTDDMSGSGLTGWNPDAYLFEHNLIP